MLLDLNKNNHKELLEKMLWRRLPDLQEIHSIEQLTGGASRQMFKAQVQQADQPLTIVLRRLSSGGESKPILEQLPLSKEVVVLRVVIEAGVAVPQVYFEFEPEDEIGEGYAMQYIEGETLGGRIAKSKRFFEARKQLTKQSAIALAKIHQVDVAATELAPHLPTVTATSAIEKMYQVYRRSNLDIPMIEYAANWLRDNTPAAVSPTLIHADFRNGNIMVDPQKGLVSVLDWELAALGDPMRDLAWLCLMPWRFGVGHLPVGGFGTTEELFQVYEAASGIKVDQDRFKFWQVYGCYWWSITCIMMGLSYRLEEGKLADRIAIGRRHTEGLMDIVNLLMPGPIDLPTVAASNQENDIATLRELIQATQKDITTMIMPTAKGKSLFVARVAISNLGTALREVEQGPYRDQEEIKSTNALLKENFEEVLDCRKALCEQLRKGNNNFEEAKLQMHLKNCIARQIAIDQPTYAGLKEARKDAT